MLFFAGKMSKRVVELTCGDPKSNQQTASKVECVVNINNHGPRTSVERGVKVTDAAPDTYIADECDVEVADAEKPPKKVSREAAVKGPISSLYVRREILGETRDIPAAAEGYIQTASRPTITESEILSSIAVKDVLLRGFANILTTNDVALAAQIVNASQCNDRKITLMLPDLKALIGSIIRLVDPEFEDKDVRIRTVVNDIDVGCCGMSKKVIVNPFNVIDSISVGNQDLKIHQFEAYNVIEEKLGVSLLHVYSALADKALNEQSTQLTV